jgi:hypothetical protein
VHRSRITEFYFGEASDHRGRSLEQLQTQSFEALEAVHDYVQWLFPLPERSSSNPHAPTLSHSDIDAFKRSPELRDNLFTSWRVMLRFYGFEVIKTASRMDVLRSNAFDARRQVWLTPLNHNFLRITRILRSLKLLDCANEAHAFLACLREVYGEYHSIIGQRTYHYWKSAAQ